MRAEAEQAVAMAEARTPVGILTVTAIAGGVRSVGFRPEGVVVAEKATADPRVVEDATAQAARSVAKQAARELEEFFAGERRHFTVPLAPGGTEFQQAVWRELGRIPFGETRTYGEVAWAVGRPRASRAVGGAAHANPILIMIPCHRMVGANGALVGFGGGLDLKRKLLDWEAGRLSFAP